MKWFLIKKITKLMMQTYGDTIAKKERASNKIMILSWLLLLKSCRLLQAVMMGVRSGSILTNKYAKKATQVVVTMAGQMWSMAVRKSRSNEPKKSLVLNLPTFQPHSGSQASVARYGLEVEPGDTVMGMDLGCRWAFWRTGACELLWSKPITLCPIV